MNRYMARIEDSSPPGANLKRGDPRATIATVVSAAVAAVLLVPTVSFAQEGNAIEPHQVASLRSVGTVDLSPDGNLAAYLLSVPRRPLDEDSGSPWTELHVLDMNEPGSSRPYITGEVNVGRPGA